MLVYVLAGAVYLAPTHNGIDAASVGLFQLWFDSFSAGITLVTVIAVISERYLMRFRHVKFLGTIDQIDDGLRTKFAVDTDALSNKRFVVQTVRLWMASSAAIVCALALFLVLEDNYIHRNERFIVAYLLPMFCSALENQQFTVYVRVILVRFERVNAIAAARVDEFVSKGNTKSLLKISADLREVYRLLARAVQRLNYCYRWSLATRNLDGVTRALYVGSHLVYATLNGEEYLLKKACICFVSTVYNTSMFILCGGYGYLVAEEVR